MPEVETTEKHDTISCLCNLPQDIRAAKLAKARAFYLSRDPNLTKAAGDVGYAETVFLAAKDEEAWEVARDLAYAGDSEAAKAVLKGGALLETKVLRRLRIAETILEKKLEKGLNDPDSVKAVDLRYLIETTDRLYDLRRKLDSGTNKVGSGPILPDLSLGADPSNPDSLDSM